MKDSQSTKERYARCFQSLKPAHRLGRMFCLRGTAAPDLPAGSHVLVNDSYARACFGGADRRRYTRRPATYDEDMELFSGILTHLYLLSYLAHTGSGTFVNVESHLRPRGIQNIYPCHRAELEVHR